MNLKSVLIRRSPEILMGGAIAGVISTAVLTATSTIKAYEVLHQEDMFYDTFADRAKKTWQYYIPPILTGTLTIACIATMRNVQAGRIAAGWAGAALAQRELRDYRSAVAKRLGSKAERSVRDDVAKRRVTELPAGQSVVITEGKVLCLDMLSGRTFESTPDAVKKAENAVNYDLVHGDPVALNDFYDKIGLEHTTLGQNLGWGIFDKVELVLSSQLMADNTPVLAISFENDPRPDFYHNN